MKKEYDIINNRKIYYFISIGIILVGVIFNLIFGTALDVQFKGGSIVNYSFTGELITKDTEDEIADIAGSEARVQITNTEDPTTNNLSITITKPLTPELQDSITKTLTEAHPDNAVTFLESNSVSAGMGQEFFLKCMVAVALAFIILILYIAVRFRKIGGWSAGVMAIIALLHDVAIAYFTFVIFRIPINDNFIAVVLTVLGYSINDTIIIYDRVRENRRIMGPKVPVGKVVNTSINQSLGRAVHTSVTSFLSIGAVAVLAMIYGIGSILSFALPMMLGIVSGLYSSIFISNGLWVDWKEHVARKAEKAKIY